MLHSHSRAFAHACVSLAVLLVLLLAGPASADLRSNPTWWDQNAVGSSPDWHYRVPVNVPAGAAVNSTVKVDVDFNALMATMGISGTFDANSPRIVRPGGSLAARQEFTDAIYNGVTDASGNGRGEVRFILEDAGASVYFIYFDITQNGAKAANPQTPINGNFERGATGTAQPAGWNAPSGAAGLDAQVRPSESPSISTNGTGAAPSPKTTAGTPNTGNFSYLIGARSANEPGAGGSRTITKTFAVPALSPGDFTIRWRTEGWDAAAFDNLTVTLSAGATTINVVGPSAASYASAPYAPNAGTGSQSSSAPGRRPYNNFDLTSTGAHTSGMTVTAQAEPWWTRTVSLSPLAGQTATLTVTSTHAASYRSWFHIDDVEWSVVTATLGAPQGFGVVFLTPTAATAGITPLSISARVDANPTASSSPVTVEVINPGGSSIRTARLFNDGTHGDAVAGDAVWTNDGSVPADRLVLPGGALNGSWRLRVFARDASTSTVGARNGVIRGPGTGTAPETEANYWNIDEFLLGGGALSVTKTSSVVSDPFNGTTNPKRIPDATILYCILVSNTGSGPVTSIVLTDTINMPEVYVTGSLRSGATCADSVIVEDDNSSGVDESDPVGASFNGTTVNGATASLAAGSTIALVYNVTVQ